MGPIYARLQMETIVAMMIVDKLHSYQLNYCSGVINIIMVERLKVAETSLKGVFIIVPTVHNDGRGYFFDSYDQQELEKYGFTHFVQQSQSLSRQGVIRGLHFQKPPYAQAKLVRVLKGTILDVIVDMRKGSPTYGQHCAIELSDADHKQIYIPEGLAHGFSVLSETAIVLYNLSRTYNPPAESGIYYLDSDLAIDWKVKNPLVSDKDKKWPKWKEQSQIFTYPEYSSGR